MSTQVQNQEAAHATELTAEAVNQEATRDYPFTIRISEKFGRAFISWKLDPNYAMGPEDAVVLRENDTVVRDWKIKGLSGEVDTGRVWGSGLNASYWARNFADTQGRFLVTTPNT